MNQHIASNIFEVSETFMSLEGESKYTFHPTVYARLARDNQHSKVENQHLINP